MWRAHDGMGWWMTFGGLLWLAIWVSVVHVVLSAVARRPSGDEGAAKPTAAEHPLDIARRRYASGEITREEFLRLSQDLGAHDLATGRNARAG